MMATLVRKATTAEGWVMIAVEVPCRDLRGCRGVTLRSSFLGSVLALSERVGTDLVGVGEIESVRRARPPPWAIVDGRCPRWAMGRPLTVGSELASS